jgi:tRNA(Ile)-lysidine synthase
VDALVASVLEISAARGWLRAGSRLLVACSGGGDSCFLLRALAAGAERRRYDLACLHVHHGLRGAEADADASFVEALARDLDLPFALRRVDVPGERLRRGRGSVEAVARELRYAAFVEVARELSCPTVATGHTRDDLVETVLLGLLRGGGMRAAQGIPPERSIAEDPPVRVVRPLLEVPRERIAVAMAANGWPFRTDASNLDAGPMRNRIRARAVPVLRELGGDRFDASVARLAGELREAEDLLERLSREFRLAHPEERLPVSALATLPRPVRLRVLRDAIESSAARPATREVLERLETLLDAPPGRTESGPGTSLALREKHAIVFLASRPAPPSESEGVPLPVPGEAVAMGYRFRAWLEERAPDLGSLGPFDQAFDPSACAAPLLVRARRPGDRFHPLGAPGIRKVSDFLIDRKVPRAQRDGVPILACGERVLWVVGHRIEETAKVPPGTQRALRVCADSRPGPDSPRSEVSP